jgi:poly(3-hydroxybutyrate) depolymerase/CubicO group peptidase (beta-lactamase class C family)
MQSLPRSWSFGLAVLLASAPSLAQTPELPPVTEAVAGVVNTLQLKGAGLVAVRAGGELHRSTHGNFDAATPLPIASASKWLAVAAIMTLVDAEQLDLDQPVARYLPEFDRDDKRRLTLRQCLACTGGVPARLPESLRGMDMKAFVAEAADTALREQSGTTFRYGGVGFQIVAAAAERVSGKSWHELFATAIAAPLGLRNTKFGTLQPIGGEAGSAALPWVAGGALSTLDDYARFLRMLVGRGELDGVRVLRASSVESMFRDQVPAMVEVHAVGFDADDVRYGLGTWLQRLPDGAIRVSDPGAFGFTPWIDLDLGIGGVFGVVDRAARVLEQLKRVQQVLRTTVASPMVAGTEREVKLSHGGRDRRYLVHVPPHDGKSALPLLLVLHGGGGNADQVRETTGLATAGVRAGFVVVFADGTGPLRGKLLTWNSGGIPVWAVEHGVDDVGFLRAVVASVQGQVSIDPQRVFACGHSNGGMMCHRLARDAGDLFAGIAVVSGAMNHRSTDAQQPIAVLLLHGTADQHVRYDGGAPAKAIGRAGERVDASVQDAIDYYLERNGLRAEKVTERSGKVRIDDYDGARGGVASAPVRVITIEGAGHSWPGGKTPVRAVADTPFPFDASAAIVKFFAEFAPVRPPAATPR